MPPEQTDTETDERDLREQVADADSDGEQMMDSETDDRRGISETVREKLAAARERREKQEAEARTKEAAEELEAERTAQRRQQTLEDAKETARLSVPRSVRKAGASLSGVASSVAQGLENLDTNDVGPDDQLAATLEQAAGELDASDPEEVRNVDAGAQVVEQGQRQRQPQQRRRARPPAPPGGGGGGGQSDEPLIGTGLALEETDSAFVPGGRGENGSIDVAFDPVDGTRSDR